MEKFYSHNDDKLAHVAINKSLLKEYHSSQDDRIVYLNNGDEFQISIFNPYDYVIGVSFSFNSNNVDNSKLLVLKPGERVWLDRYLNEERKLMFSTYEVDDCNEAKKAIAKNGLLTIHFYKEKEENHNWYNIYDTKLTASKPIDITYTGDSPNWYYDNSVTCYHNNIADTCTTSLNASAVNCSSWTAASIDADGNYSYSDSNGNHYVDSAITISGNINSNIKNGLNSCVNKTNFNKSIETGRIEKGRHSNQKFSNYYGDFNDWSFRTERIKLLPMSQKQVNTNDLKKKYCPECGRKIKDKFKFCPYCGTEQ